jgi:hypothetical protein
MKGALDMFQIPVIPLGDPAQLPLALQQEHARHLAGVRRRAYELYCGRGRETGHDLENWHDAESQLKACKASGVEEDGKRVRIVTRLQPAVANRLHVTAFPREIFVDGGEPELFERFPLPVEIDPSSVCAALDKDLLTITAQVPRPGSSAVISQAASER